MYCLTEEELALRKEIREFTDREILPGATELDASKIYPVELVRKIREAGYPALSFPKELGGQGKSLRSCMIFLEEISRGLASLGLVYTANTMQVCYSLVDAVTEQQKQEWLMPAIQGEKILTLALSEDAGGSDAFAINTYAQWHGDGWILNGSKCWISNAGVADGYIVAARTTPHGRSHDISLFFVDSHTPGVDDSERANLVGMNNDPTSNIFFHDCHLPPKALISNPDVPDSGYHLIKRALNSGRLALSAVAIGLAQGALEDVVSYTKNRSYLGRRISGYQGVSFPIAEMMTNISLARHMLYHTADIYEAGDPASVDIAELKLFSCEMCQSTCTSAAQLHGAIGYDKRVNNERRLRDSLLFTTMEGTSQICKIIISNALYNNPPEMLY
jgi:butyryl-CoA dehydrogenase